MTDLRFKVPFNMIVCGPTQSGKTTLVKELIRYKNELFDRPPQHIIYCYGSEWQRVFDELKTYGVQFIKGLPKQNIATLFPKHKRPGLLILDDLMNNVKDSDDIVQLFTKGTHHCDVCAIYIAQNPFPGGKHGRTMSINTHYNILFKNPRDCLSTSIIFRQMFPNKSKRAMKAYEQAVDKQYGYLFLDYHPQTPDFLRLQGCILPNEAPRECYIFDDQPIPTHYLHPDVHS